MSNGSGVGVAAGGVLLIGVSYWFAMASIAVAAGALVGGVILAGLAIYVIVGSLLYIVAIFRAISGSDEDALFILVGGPILAGVVMVVIMGTMNALGIPAITDLLAKYDDVPGNGSLIASLVFIALAVAYMFTVWPAVMFGWIVCALMSYNEEPVSVFLWMLWGGSVSLLATSDTWSQAIDVVKTWL